MGFIDKSVDQDDKAGAGHCGHRYACAYAKSSIEVRYRVLTAFAPILAFPNLGKAWMNITAGNVFISGSGSLMC